MIRPAAVVALLSFASSAALAACGNTDEPYKPAPAWSGKKANLPPPPTLSTTPIKAGDAYTIFGAVHQLRSRYHTKDVTKDPITITGYIVESNIPDAPECAIHPTGKQDPDNCTPPIPSFWIADTKGDTKGLKIRVIGWARNFAVVYDAIKKYNSVKEPPKELVKDETLSVDVPFPLPAVGAKVKITGKYGVTWSGGSDLVSDPQTGVMAFQKLDYLEKAPELAEFKAKKL